MFQRGELKDPFFNMKALAPRPVSNATEMFDTDFEDDDSEVEEADSPRFSLNSVCCLTLLPIFTPLTEIYLRLVEGVRLPYHLLRKYTHQVQTPKSSRDSTSIYRGRSRCKDREGRIFSEVH